MNPADLRRLLHACTAAVALFGAVSAPTLRLVTAYLAATAVVVEIVRLRVPAVRSLLARVAPVYRAQEERRPSGAMWLAIGYALAALFPAPANVAGVLAGGLADPAGALVGTRAGVPGGKTLPGTLAVTAATVTLSFALGLGWGPAVVAGVVAGAAERWSGPIDDNLVVAPAVAIAVALVA